MADYAKLKIGFVYSENSDYSLPRLNALIDAYTSSTATHYEVQYRNIGTVAETLELGGFTTIQAIIIKNKDATNYVTETHRSAGNSSTDNINRIAAGKICILTDVTVSGDLILTANTAAVDVEVYVFGT